MGGAVNPYHVRIKRRTAGERLAYLQGHLAALRMVATCSGVSDSASRQFAIHADFDQSQIDRELGERKAKRKAKR